MSRRAGPKEKPASPVILSTERHRLLIAALRAARQQAQLTQRQLAARLGRARSYVGKIETGQRQVGAIELCELAAAIGADPRNLLTAVIGDSPSD